MRLNHRDASRHRLCPVIVLRYFKIMRKLVSHITHFRSIFFFLNEYNNKEYNVIFIEIFYPILRYFI